MNNILTLIANTLFASVRLAAPLAFAGIGESISQTTGVLNIGVEGMMLSGAFACFLSVFYTNSILLGIFAGMFTGMLIGLLHAYITVTAMRDQNISGLAINYISLGLTSFFFLVQFGRSTILPDVKTLPTLEIPILSKFPVLGFAFFTHDALTYALYIMVILATIFLKRTDYGTKLIAVGENPGAADTAGISVTRTRYYASLFNGLMCGLAGSYMMVVSFGFFIENITNGRGFLALAAVTLGRRNPLAVFFVSLLFGLSESVQFAMQSFGVPIPSQIFTMLPYLMAVVVLLFSIGRSQGPACLTVPYDRNER